MLYRKKKEVYALADGGIKKYRRFIYELREQLIAAISEAEQQGWHHSGGPCGDHYNRLLTWYEEFERRCVYYAETQRKRPKWVPEIGA